MFVAKTLNEVFQLGSLLLHEFSVPASPNLFTKMTTSGVSEILMVLPTYSISTIRHTKDFLRVVRYIEYVIS